MVGQRFCIQREIDGGYLAADQRADRQATLVPIGPEQCERYRPAVGLEHAHLATLLALIEGEPAGALAAFERVEGESLQSEIERLGKLDEATAVRHVLRIVDGVSAWHAAGATHGLVRAENFVLEPKGRKGPLLVPRSVPASLTTTAATQADDARALASLLFQLLSGKPEPSDLSAEHIKAVADPELSKLLSEILIDGNTSEGVKPFKRKLARWLVDLSDQVAPTHSGPPPPLPSTSPTGAAPAPTSESRAPNTSASTAAAPSKAPTSPPPSTAKGTRRRRIITFTAAGIVLGLGGAWAFAKLSPEPAPVADVQPAPTPVQTAEAAVEQGISLEAVAVTGEETAPVAIDDKLTSCVAAYLPKGSLLKPVDLAFLCDAADPKQNAPKLRSAVVSAGAGKTTPAMKIWSRLGWYELVAHSVLRSGCCLEPAALSFPDPSPGCEALAPALSETAAKIISAEPFDDALESFTAAATCEAKAGKAAAFGQSGPPQPYQEAALRELVRGVQGP